ncbi:ABC transporter ATP-binding protein [Bradyrhizobium jicamae]|nr:ABC transporter ATP-binding protein [Bradyrhizobium jicamae]
METCFESGVSVQLQKLSKSFESAAGEELSALSEIDLRIEPGEFVAIVGPSGCGKSTLLSMIAGLERPSTGILRVDDEALTGPHPRAGVVFQSDYLLPWRTILGNVLLPIEIKGLDLNKYRSVADELLVQVGLSGFASKLPFELSGGMRQRAAICRAIIQRPGLLLMDEPFGALDALTREQMVSDLQALWMRLGNTVVFITHGIDEAIFLADRVIVLSPRPGRIDLEVKIDLPRPRKWADAHLHTQFHQAMVDIRDCFERRGILHAENLEQPAVQT